MSVAIVILDRWEPEGLLVWGAQFARALGEDLLVLGVSRRADGPAVTSLDSEGSDESHPLVEAVAKVISDEYRHRVDLIHDRANTKAADKPQVPLDYSIKQIQHREPRELILDQIRSEDVKLLILPRSRVEKSTSDEFEVRRQLFRDAPCATMQLVLGARMDRFCREIVVPTRGHRSTSRVLHTAARLADANDGHVTALYVLQDFDPSTESVGREIICNMIEQHAADVQDRLTPRAFIHANVVEGIRTVMREGCDLLLMGATYHSKVHRTLFPSITEQLLATPEGPAMAVIRPPIPLRSLAYRVFESSVGDVVPQLERNKRKELVKRIHSSSQWDFDFIALVCLSTLIATLGLMQNSTAVVIGAMLVAPLMTPLLGAGLSLVQGNKALAHSATSTVGRGFLLALAIAWIVGLAVGGKIPTEEMLARGSPGIFDLVVAFASGVAAAYASGRPNLVSALPGVAIAAALVPPIATCGLGLSMQSWGMAVGALLLFLTNIVAIVLGAACALWAVGVRGAHAHGFFSPWAARAIVALVLITILLGIYEATAPLLIQQGQ